MSTYSEYQNAPVSEKIGLVTLDAVRKLTVWTLIGPNRVHDDFDYVQVVLLSNESTGATYTEVGSLDALAPDTFFNDRVNKKLYVRTAAGFGDSIVKVVVRFFFSNVSLIAPWDLSTGKDVLWEPMLKNTSRFGVEVDNQQRQLGIAIESRGSVVMYNDKDFWRDKYDNLFFENKDCYIYSWNRSLPVTEAKLLFKGIIDQKDYTQEEVRFRVKDFFNPLRSRVSVNTLGDVPSGTFVPVLPDRDKEINQRLVYGAINGHDCQNMDPGNDTGFLRSWTVTGDGGDLTKLTASANVLGSVLPGDRLRIPDGGVTVSVDDVVSGTGGTEIRIITPLTVAQATAISASAVYSIETRHGSTFFLVSQNELCEPKVRVIRQSSPGVYEIKRVDASDTVVSTPTIFDDLKIGDVLYDREQVQFNTITDSYTIVNMYGDNLVRLSGDLTTLSIGDNLWRYPVSNVYINDRLLDPETEWKYDSSRKIIQNLTTVNDPNKIFRLTGTLSATGANDRMTGVGTLFTSELQSGDQVFSSNSWRTVFSVISDTEIKMTGIVPFTSGTTHEMRPRQFFAPGGDVLTCDIAHGMCEGGDATNARFGIELKTAPQMVENLCSRAGLSASINASQFDSIDSLFPEKIGIAEPNTSSSRRSQSHRDVISDIGRSVLGVLYASPDFLLEYEKIRPNKPTSMVLIDRDDVMSISTKSDIRDLSSEIKYEYDIKEVDPSTNQASVGTILSILSDISTDLLDIDKTSEFQSRIVDAQDATNIGTRWRMMLELERFEVEFTSKLQTARLRVLDKLDFNHELMFNGMGQDIVRRVLQIKMVSKGYESTTVLCEDIGKTLLRCAVLAASGSLSYASAASEAKILNGYLTSNNGTVSTYENTAGLNLIW